MPPRFPAKGFPFIFIMGSICAWRGGGWPSGPLHPVTWRLSHLFLCVHSRIYIPPALLLSHGVRKGVSSSRPSPPEPPMGVQVPACYTQEEEKVTSSSERGESGGRVCLSSLAITSALGSGTGPCGGTWRPGLSLLQRLKFSLILMLTGRQALCRTLGSPWVSSPALVGSTCTRGSAHQDQDNTEPSWAPSSTVCKALLLPLP